MRWLLWLSLALGAVWAGYWFVGSNAVENGVTQWFQAQAAQGITATQDGIEVGGFPSRFDLTVSNPRFDDPVSGWGWSAPFAQVLSMTWKPWHLIAVLPNEQRLQVPGQGVDLQSSSLHASLRLEPSTDLTLDEVIVEGRDLLAKSDLGWQVGAKSLVLAMARDLSRDNAQRLGIEIADLAPDQRIAALVPDLGALVSEVHLDATVLLSAPLDRRAGESQPAVRGVEVADFHAYWGSLKIFASGKVGRAAQGFAEGKIEFRIENWRAIPKLIVALDLVQPAMGDTIERGLDVLAKSGSDPDVLVLPLEFIDGRMNLGPLPLGPAPMLD